MVTHRNRCVNSFIKDEDPEFVYVYVTGRPYKDELLEICYHEITFDDLWILIGDRVLNMVDLRRK